MLKLNAKELRNTVAPEEIKKTLQKNPIYIICDNILDTYNTGSIFRLADAVAATKVYLCGITETPPNTRIKKASINTTEWVDWEYCASTIEAISKLRQEFSTSSNNKENSSSSDPSRLGQSEAETRSHASGIQIVLVEQDEKSVPFDSAEYKSPVAFIISNETTGATQEVIDAADMTVEMPMFGVNTSLNVMVSLGIVLYTYISKKGLGARY